MMNLGCVSDRARALVSDPVSVRACALVSDPVSDRAYALAVDPPVLRDDCLIETNSLLLVQTLC